MKYKDIDLGFNHIMETPLSEETIKNDVDSYLASRHFRNELFQFRKEYYEDFKKLAESTWDGLEIDNLEYQPLESNELRLYIKENGLYKMAEG